MIIELLQLLDFLFFKGFHLLGFFFLVTMTSYIVVAYKARKHKAYRSSFKVKTTTIIPVYREIPILFEKVLRAIKNQTDQLIVVVDGKNKELETIAKKYTNNVISNDIRSGKRKAIGSILSKVKYSITILLDSDTIVEPKTIEELVKPFSNSRIGIVQSQPRVLKGFCSFSSYKLSELTERSRDIICSALNPHLIVVDGRLQAVRTKILRQVNDEWLKDYWMGKPSEIGEDRCRTRLIHKLGFRSAYQPSAVCFTKASKTFKEFVKQQLRWFRSGYKFFLKDVWEKNMPSKMYLLQSLLFYCSPLLFTFAILFDLFLLSPIEIVTFSIWLVFPLMFFGTTLITLLRQATFYGFKGVQYRYLFFFALTGLFVMYPLMLYSLITVKEQGSWGTR